MNVIIYGKIKWPSDYVTIVSSYHFNVLHFVSIVLKKTWAKLSGFKNRFENIKIMIPFYTNRASMRLVTRT